MKSRSPILPGLFVVLAATALLPLLPQGANIMRDALAFPADGLGAIMGAVLLGWVAKAIKYRMLTARLDRTATFAHSLALSLGCDFAFTASPAGVGGYPATVLLCKRIGIDAPRAVAIAVGDQILDLAFFALAMPLALVCDFPGAQRFDARDLVIVAAIAVLVALAAGLGRKHLAAFAHGAFRKALTKLRRIESLDRHWCEFRDHLRQLRSAPPRFIAGIAFATATQWLARYATLGIALAWLGTALPFASVFLAQAASLHAGQWTGIPGGMGAADGILLETLRHWVPLASLATALVVWRLATFHLTLAAGGIAFALLTMHKPKPHAAAPVSTALSLE